MPPGAAVRRHFGITATAAAGAALVASGLVYAAVALATHASMEGPTSLRKPMLFGLSTGVSLLSAAWVMRAIPKRRGDELLYGSLAVALFVEVFLIDLQQARGVPSHFSSATPFDAAATDAMGALVVYSTFVFALLTVRAFGRLRLPPDLALAARAGLVLFVLGCGLGMLITAVGEAQIASGRPPELYGDRGVLKFPHGLPLHALQMLPLLALGFARLGMSLRGRVLAVGFGSIATAFGTAFALVQTFSGAPRWPPTAAGWVFVALVVAAASLIPVLAVLDRRSVRSKP